MSNFKNNSKYPIEPSSDEPFVPYFLRSSRATEPIGGRDYVIFPDSFPNIGMPLTGEEMLMVQGKLPEPEILTPNQIKEYFSGSVVQDSQGFVTGDQVYKELLKYVPITRKVNGYALDKDIWLNKADVGLGNVDNTSDLNKPISTATQEALDNLESKHDSEIARLDAKDVDLQNQINDLETSGGEIRQELINHMKDPNAHPEIVDQTMSDTSTKAISNKIVKAYIDTIIGRQGSKNSVVANDEILVMGADGKYYRATIQKAVLDLVDSTIGDIGKVLHFVGEAGNSAGIPDINSQKDGAVFYVSKLATPTTTITDAVTGQNFTSCDVVMKDGSQWKIIGKTMWWVNLAYSYSEPNKKATITNTAGTGFEIPLASDTVTGLYPKEHFYDVSRASATPAAGIIPKYTSESKLKSGASATSNGEVLIYEQIQQILDLARIGVNYSILDMSNPIKAIYNSGSTGTGSRPITPFWDYSVGLTNCCGGDNNSIILKQNSEMVGTTNSVVGTVILTGSLVDRIKLTNKLYCSMDFDTLVNEQASLKITIKNGKSGTILGEVSLLTVDLAGMYSGYVELDTTSLDSSTNNFLTIEMVFTPTSKMSDVELPDGEGEAVVTKPADWSTNKVDKVCISVDPIDDTSLDVITQSELSRIQPILTHIANANVHVTKQDKDTWDAKATEDFVLQKIQDLIGDAPDVLDTLEELAEALKNNPDIIDNILNDLTDIRTKYLPLTGGLDHTLTGITYVAANWILSQGIYHVIQTNDALNMFGSDGKDTTIVTKSGVDIQHLKGTTSYKIWDASNLPSPASTTDLSKYALLAGNNTFSGSNTFALNKFQVGTGSLFRVNANASLIVDGIVTGGWNKELVYYSREASSSTAVKRGAFGIKADGATESLDSDYLYLSVREADWRSAQYKFQANKLTVPNTWSLRTSSGFNLIKVDDVNEIRFGSNSIPNYLVSNNTDITHRKYTVASTYTDYKMWDESNLPSPASKSDLSDYLPLSGGNMSGGIVLGNGVAISGKEADGATRSIASITPSNILAIGNTLNKIIINTGDFDIFHNRNHAQYKIYDSYNLPNPVQTSDLASYLPLAGGTLTGDLVLSNNNYIKGILSTGSPIQILGLTSSDTILVGNGSYNLLLYTGASDISHWKGGTSYKIWDASNVSKPLNYVNGTAGSVTSVYARNLNLNGTNYPFIGTGTTTVTLFAPTTAGTSGQVLQSQGAGKAPIWVDGGAGGGVQLSDDNVWTGLNTFQGGLKTSDGTNSYDVWDNNSLKYPVKYAINSTGTGYALSFYSKTAGWKEIDTLTTKYLTSATVKSISAGGDGYIGIGTNAYASAAISEINTNSIYFRGLNNTVLSTNDDGKLEYGSRSNYAGFNSGNIRIAYPFASSSGGGVGGGGGTIDPFEGGLTISYYPVNTISRVTERAKIYCTTSNLYLKDLAKNTQLDFDTDGLYVTTGSSSKVRLATLNDVSGGGSSVSLDGDNTWTGVNIFSGTGLVTNQYDSGNTEIPASAKYSVRLACGGSYNEYGFGAIRTEDRIKQSYAFVQTPSAFFTFDNSGSLYTTTGSTKYEFWNKQNLAKPITYNTNTEGDAVLYKGDSASKIDRLVLPATMPDDSSNNILQGGTGGFGSAEHAYASCHIGAVYTNEIHTYIDNDMTATVNLTIDDSGVYFTKSDGTLYKLTMEVVP
jgi:hypothetical protein